MWLEILHLGGEGMATMGTPKKGSKRERLKRNYPIVTAMQSQVGVCWLIKEC